MRQSFWQTQNTVSAKRLRLQARWIWICKTWRIQEFLDGMGHPEQATNLLLANFPKINHIKLINIWSSRRSTRGCLIPPSTGGMEIGERSTSFKFPVHASFQLHHLTVCPVSQVTMIQTFILTCATSVKIKSSPKAKEISTHYNQIQRRQLPEKLGTRTWFRRFFTTFYIAAQWLAARTDPNLVCKTPLCFAIARIRNDLLFHEILMRFPLLAVFRRSVSEMIWVMNHAIY